MIQFPSKLECENLKEISEFIEETRVEILFGFEDKDTLKPLAEQHFLLALSSLDQAARHMQMVEIFQKG